MVMVTMEFVVSTATFIPRQKVFYGIASGSLLSQLCAAGEICYDTGLFWLSYSVQSTKGTVLRPKQNTAQVSFPNEIPQPWSAYCQWACKWNTLLNPMKFSATLLLRYCTERNPGCAATESFIGHIAFSPVWVIGSAVKSFWMRSLLWGNHCKQCYQADCRRKCPSSAERSNLGTPSCWYFRLLDAGPCCLLWKSDIKEVTHWWARVYLHAHFNHFTASSAGLRKEDSTTVFYLIDLFHSFSGFKLILNKPFV